MVLVTSKPHRGSPGSIPRRSQIYCPFLPRNWRVKMMAEGYHEVVSTSVRWLLQNGGNWGRLLTAKTRNARGASHQPAFMNCLTTSHMWYLCLSSSRWVKALCSMTPYDWPRWFCWRFWDMVSMVLLIGSWCYSWEWVWNLMTKLCCVASGKWNISRVWLQEFDITYIMP